MSRSVTGGWRSEWKWFVVAAALIAPACSGNTNPGFGDTAGQDASTADGSVGDGGDSSSVSDGTSHLDIAMLDAGIDASDAGGSNDVHAGIDVPDATDIADGGSDMGADETTEQDAATDAASSDADAETACDAGGTMSCGVGACRRIVAACVNGMMGVCVPGQPTPEVCDGIDNDCDGTVDDGLGSTSCGVGACQRTVQNCLNGSEQTCVAGQPTPEVCDGIDNDCNGLVDDGLGSTTCGIGACQRTTLNCVNGMMQMCAAGQPRAEVCNGIDDDCDGVIDDGLGSGTCGVGACQRTTQNCVNGMMQMCVPGTAHMEICNGIDDDCNGLIDDGLGTLTCGVGACGRTVQACVNGMPQTCVPGQPTAEICDSIDNNCNGLVDEGDPGGGMACATGLPGLCSTGVTHCLSGADQCVPNIMPGQLPEVCNGVDDNCNGLIDEGDPGGGTSCPTGLEGVCAAGATHCMMGSDRCEQNVQPSAEICDGLDNNCNGLVDDGLGTTTCGIGPCQATTQNCVNGRTNPCVPGTPQPEICDNVDNNCNGVVDDGPWQQLCPPPANVFMETCTNGTCGMEVCDPGYYDADGNTANGCECVGDTVPQVCTSASSLGSIASGQANMATGNIPRANTSTTPGAGDWYVVQFPPNNVSAMQGSGTPAITVTSTASGEFVFDLLPACTGGTQMTCGVGGPNASGRNDWSFTDNVSLTGQNQFTSRNVAWPNTVYIRVYRLTAGESCDSYTLSVTR